MKSIHIYSYYYLCLFFIHLNKKQEVNARLVSSSSSRDASLEKDYDQIQEHNTQDDPLAPPKNLFDDLILQSFEHQEGRSLQQGELYPCDHVLATIPPSEVANVAKTNFFDVLFGEASDFVFSNFSPFIQYGVQVKTVCASCVSVQDDFNRMYTPHLSSEARQSYESFCGEGVYGHNETYSGLAMIPLVVEDETDVLKPLSGPMMAYIIAKISGGTNKFNIPSQWWGGRAPPTLTSANLDLLMSLLATSTKGTISIQPDYMGFGFNENNSFRGFMLRKSYLTSFIPLWMKIRSSMQLGTNCESRLADTAFVQGYSEGGKETK